MHWAARPGGIEARDYVKSSDTGRGGAGIPERAAAPSTMSCERGSSAAGGRTQSANWTRCDR